jgi:uncharacterized circularly permuted ATP-grasp superfamily protein
LDTPVGEELITKYTLQKRELRKTTLNMLLENYRNTGKKDKPRIAIIDFMDKATVYEFEALRDTFIKEGYDTVIWDIRELVYKDGLLWCGNKSVDLIYRRAVTSDIFDRYDEAGEFIKGYKNGAACFIGSFRSDAAHSKLIFTFLTSKEAENFFTDKQIEFLKEHLPKTWRLRAKDAAKKETELSEKKDKYIIKPHNSYGAQGIFMGKYCTSKQWAELLTQHADTNYIAQELIDVPKEDFITMGKKVEKLSFTLGPYHFNGQLKGFYTRVSHIDIITTSRGGALVPTFIQKGTMT